MFSAVKTCSLQAMEGTAITVETVITHGMPYFSVVGLPDDIVQESKERIRSAFTSCQLELPSQRITVNLAPAYRRKDCSGFDLPMAISILISQGSIPVSPLIDESLLIGELSLNGQLRSVPGSMLMAQHARKWGLKRIILSAEDAWNAAFVPDIEVIGIHHLSEAIEYLCSRTRIEPSPHHPFIMERESDDPLLCLKGQPLALRALTIAAAGFHPLLLYGPPGTGKTTAANALISLLPPPDQNESLEIASIYNSLGLPIPSKRPFRSPHHTISPPALVGGGSVVRPGEITLAHHGVLFLDELAQFRSQALETFRQPLENHAIVLNRLHHSVTLPAFFLLVSSMNPCPCGFYPDRSRCSCSPAQIRGYLNRIRGPLLDRIDLCVYLDTPKYSDIHVGTAASANIQELKKQVEEARERQRQRFEGSNLHYNSELNADQLVEYCHLDDDGEAFMEQAYMQYRLSVRGYHRIIKIARTIADLESSDRIRLCHLQEAVQLRSSDMLDQIQ